MKLYKNGVCVYESVDAYVDTIADYINEKVDDCIDFLRPWEYIQNSMEGCGDMLQSVIDLCPGIMGADENDYIIAVYSCPFFFPFDMQETDSKEAVDVWLSVLQQIDFDATWKIELDEQ